MVFLASYTAFGGGSLGNVLAQWESAGIFTYALPFLLIFAIIYAILTNVRVFKDNKPVNAVISLAVALLALQFQIVPIFFAEIFPRLGIALSVILVVLVLLNFAVDTSQDGNKWLNPLLGIITAIVLVVVILGSLRSFGFGGGFGSGWFYGIPWGTVIFVVIIIGALAAIVFGGKGNKQKQ